MCWGRRLAGPNDRALFLSETVGAALWLHNSCLRRETRQDYRGFASGDIGLGTRELDPNWVGLAGCRNEPGGNPQIWSETVDRAQKEQLVDDLGQIFESSGVVVVSHYDGLTVAEMQDLRAQMREAGGSVRVAKNKLAKIALEGKPCASIAEYLDGMTVLAYSEDPVAAAKVVDAYAKR